LNYHPQADTSNVASQCKPSFESTAFDPNPEREEEYRQRQEYWANVRYAQNQLYNYYGTACHFFPAARADLVKVQSMSPDEILHEASKHRLI
jgi:hypothetical protein